MDDPLDGKPSEQDLPLDIIHAEVGNHVLPGARFPAGRVRLRCQGQASRRGNLLPEPEPRNRTSPYEK
jgi:hypothetical protein